MRPFLNTFLHLHLQICKLIFFLQGAFLQLLDDKLQICKLIFILSGARQGLSRALGGRRWLLFCKTPVCAKRKVNILDFWKKKKEKEKHRRRQRQTQIQLQDKSFCKEKGEYTRLLKKKCRHFNKKKTNTKPDMHVKWELPCLDRRTQNEQINWCKLCGSRNANTHQILTRSLQTFSCRLFTNTESKEAIWGTYSSSKISGESCFPIISCQRIRTDANMLVQTFKQLNLFQPAIFCQVLLCRGWNVSGPDWCVLARKGPFWRTVNLSYL